MDPTPPISPQHSPRSTGRSVVPGLVYALAGMALLLWVVLTSAPRIGQPFPGFLVWDNGVLPALYGETWTGARAGLPFNGGVLVEVNGEAFRGGRALQRHVAAQPVGIEVRYRVRVAGELRDYTVPTMVLSAWDYASTFGTYLLLAVTFLGVGAVALALRPDGVQARSLAVSFGLIGAAAALTIEHVTAHRLPLCQVAEISVPAALLHLALVFPVERLDARSRRALTGAVAALCLVAAALNLLWFHSDPELARAIVLGAYVGMATVVAGLFASVAEAVYRARDPQARMQAAVVLAAVLPGALLPGAAMAAFSLLGWTFSWTWAMACLSLFAVAFLYAVMRHDLFQAERLVRLTIGYSVVSTAVVLAYGTGGAVLQRALAPGSVTESVATFAFLIGVVLLSEPLRRKVQLGIDRSFFRVRIDFARVLEDSSTALARLSALDEIRGYVEKRLCDALSLEWVALRLHASAEPERTAALEEPLVFGSERLGRVACGPKRSGAPFSDAERELVRGIASQAALAVQKAEALDELARAQEALLRAERLAAIGEFAGVVAHGLRNPLAGIRATTQLARREATDQPTDEALACVLAEVDRLDHRIRTLLDFSRPYAPRREATDLATIVREVVHAIDAQARGAGAEVVTDLPERPVVREIDAAYLEEAVLELAANGLRSMTDGGKLTLALREDGSGAELVVTDTGSGIPAGVRERVFDLFFTDRDEGTGLGLASVRKIVESHGGQVRIAATGPHGTSFQIHLP